MRDHKVRRLGRVWNKYKGYVGKDKENYIGPSIRMDQMWEMLIRFWVLLDVETTRKMDILSRKKTWQPWPLKRNQEITKSTYFIQMSLTQCLPDDQLARKPLKQHIWWKIKASGQRKHARDSTFSSSHGQEHWYQERLFILHFLL